MCQESPLGFAVYLNTFSWWDVAGKEAMNGVKALLAKPEGS
jgi:hypothetical protein